MLKFFNRLKKKKDYTGEEGREKLFALFNPKSPVVEAFRTLRTNIAFSSVDRTYKIILVASSIPNEGKSTVTANLGIVMAQAGARVLIVDADLRKPTQHRIFELENSRGLVNAIIQNDVQGVIQPGPIEGLSIITSGPIPPNPSELLASNRMNDFLSGIREEFDTILVDSPPALAVTDALLLASRVDGVMMVLKSGSTRLDAVKNAIEQLKKTSGEKFMGVVLNEVAVTTTDYRYYYYKKPGRKYMSV